MRDRDVGADAELGPVCYLAFGCNFTCFLSPTLLHLPFTPSSIETLAAYICRCAILCLFPPYLQLADITWHFRVVYAGALYYLLNYISASSWSTSVSVPSLSGLIFVLPSQAPQNGFIYSLQCSKWSLCIFSCPVYFSWSYAFLCLLWLPKARPPFLPLSKDITVS